MSVMKADLILTGGSILTVDKNNSIHEAVAIIKKSFQISPRVMVSLLFYWELWDSF
jgi:hypothetical protein